ncbi:hypothetical protein [Azospirillum endophyticum]
MPGNNTPAAMPPHRAASHAQSHGRPPKRLPADGNRRPVVERCAHHSGCMPGTAQVAAHAGALHNGAPHTGVPLWRTMMDRWLAAAP